jgi:hypothetical protein
VSGGRVAVNLIAFQAAWLGGVMGAAANFFWLGPALAFAAAAAHVAIAPAPMRELGAIATIAVLGTAWDALPAAAGLLEYRGGVAAIGGLPLWMAGLWLAFATTLNVSLRWVRRRFMLAAALGAAGGPASFLAAERLGAVAFVETAPALLAQAVGWALLLPLASVLAERLGSLDDTRAEPSGV